MAGTKSKSKLSIAEPFETGRELVRSLKNPATKWLADEFVDEAGKTGRTFIEQLLGLEPKKSSDATHADAATENLAAKHKDVVIFNLSDHRGSTSEKSKAQVEKPRSHAEAAIDYHGQFRNELIHSRERASRSETREMQQNIEQIKVELSRLITSSQVLKMEFAEVAVEQSTPNVGEYHINFFQWMLAVIRTARQKVEDSGSWLGTVKGKGSKRGYWGMFQQHGTTFALSGERAVATQVG